jgi:hypothetical protein
MAWEPTGTGLIAQLQVKGFARFISGGFLACWLAGWAVGETFAIRVLAAGAWSMVTGRVPGAGQEPITLTASLPAGLFLLVWLSLWTLGGIAAGRELLRLLFGRDRFVARPDGLEIEHSFGLFRSTERVSRQEIRRVYPSSAGAALSAETARGPVILTRLGTAAERGELEQALNREFSIPARPTLTAALPKGWCEELSWEHDSVLVKDPAVRRKQARTAWFIFTILSLMWCYFLAAGQERPDYGRGVIILFMLSAVVGFGAFWLTSVRNEWRLDPGRIVLQRRVGKNLKERFAGATLELVEDSSGEDGTRYQLQAAAVDVPPPASLPRAARQRRILHSQSEDATETRNLGLWLSQRCQIAFADLTTTEAKTQELQALKQQLADSGRVGRALAGVIERLDPSSATSPSDNARNSLSS